MAKAVKTVGAILVVGGLALATGGAALIPALAGGGLAGALGTAIGGITAGQLITVGTILSSVGSTPKVGAGGNPTQWKIDPDAGIPFAVGRVGVAGTIVYRREFGPENMYQGVVSVLSGAGPINAFVSFSASDEAVAFDGSGKATTSQYSGELFTQTRLGTSSQTYMVQGGLKNGSTLPGWGSSHRLLGKAARMLTLAENSKGTAFPNGEPEPLDVLQGILYWDPRLDSTYPGGSGSCRLDNPATWVYGTNPIIHALKWWLGYFENGKQVGGVGISRDAIDIPAFVDAANVADANGWIISAYPTTKDDKHQVGIAMLQAGGAVYASVGGKVSCISRGAPRASLLTVNGNDTAGPVEIDTAATRVSRINTIIPRFWSEAHRWQMTAGSPVGFSGYIDQDRGNTRIRPVDYPYVPQALQAAQLAGFDIVDSREGIVGVVPFKPHMRRLKPGMAFTFTEPGFVLSGLKCLVLNREYNPADGVVKITFRSETDAKYDLALGRTTTVPPPPALTPPDPTVEAPDSGDWIITPRLPGEDGVEVPIVDVVGEVTSATATQVHFEWAPTATGPWTSLGLWPPTTTKLPIDGLQPGQIFYVAVSNVRGQNYSDRTITGPYTAPGLKAGDVIPTAPAIMDLWAGVADLEMLQASETVIREEAITRLEARSQATPNLIRNGGATLDTAYWTTLAGTGLAVVQDPVQGPIFTGNGVYASETYPLSPGQVVSLGVDAEASNGAPFASIQFLPSGTQAQFANFGPGSFTRKTSTTSTPAPSGTTGFRVIVNTAAGVESWSRVKVNAGPVATNYSDDATSAGLSATVTQQALALIDLETQQALAKFELVAAASGGQPAIFRMVSSSLGSAIALDAPFIYFGPNTVFDRDTATIQTTVGGLIRVIAWGAPFGAGSNLLEWYGPTGIGLSSMTTGNGLNGRMTTAPYVFDNVLGNGKAGGFKTWSSSPGGATAVTTVDGVLAGSAIQMKGQIGGGSLDADASQTIQISLYEEVGGSQTLVHQEIVTVTSQGVQNPDLSWAANGSVEISSPLKAATKTGTVTYRVSMARTGGSNYVAGATLTGTVIITPPA